MQAPWEGHKAIFTLLVKAKAEVDSRDILGIT
jgi:hypothetical protein